MNRCIVHVGMPKTGTTSIQETLFFGLDDPRFTYVSGGDLNAARAILLLCTQRVPQAHLFGASGRDPAYRERRRRAYARKIEAELRRARDRGLQPVLSAEFCWKMSEAELRGLRSLLDGEGFEVQVVAYVRLWKEWIESNYQQRCLTACMYGSPPWNVDFAPAFPCELDYRERIETLDRVFGRGNVLVRKFDRRDFPDGDAVRDFCRQVGISIPGSRIRRANESLSLAATKLLAAYGRFSNREAAGGHLCRWQHGWLSRRLQELRGPSLRLHSSLVSPLVEPLLPQLDWLEERLGSSMREDLRAHDDDGDCIRDDEDLLSFGEESLRWLAGHVGADVPEAAHGEEAARQVGELVHHLRHRFPGVAILGRSVRAAAERTWVRWTKER